MEEHIELKCFFCDVSLEGDPEKELSSGDLIKCQNCGEFNDYDELVNLAAEEFGKKTIKNFQSDIKKMFDKFWFFNTEVGI